jgi:transcriptional regulator with XRE-family HTH domain
MTLLRLNANERETLGPRLRAARHLANKTLRGVADELDVNVNSVVQWEHGTLPGEENRAKLAALYGVDEDVLFAELAARLDAARALLRPA